MKPGGTIMRTLSILTLAGLAMLLAACSDSTGPSGELPPKRLLFSTTWADGELSALAYDASHDAIFLIEDVHSGENVIHRWTFADEALQEVYRSSSQHDYGMRVLGGELWVTRTYDKGFLRLGNLDQDQPPRRATWPAWVATCCSWPATLSVRPSTTGSRH
jgi:hypothetical protein